MKIYTVIILCFLNFFFTFSQKFNKRIERKIKKIEALDGAHISISLMDLNSGKKLAAMDENKYMNPASNTKLLTFLASINSFDRIPSIKYFIENDTILNFKSTGFPLLLHPIYQDLNLFKFFENKDYLVYHNSKEVIPKYGPGWSWDDYNYYFSSEVSKFPIYGNAVSFYKDSLSSNIETFPKFFNNKLKVIDKREEPLIKREELKNVYIVNKKKFKINDTIQSPFITSDSLFINLLSQTLNKKIIIKEESGSIINWETLYTQYSQDLYKALLQDSDNLVAESLLLMISNNKFQSFDSNLAIELFKNKWSSFLKDPLIWFDGSGVSRYNLITSRNLISILFEIHKKIGWKGVSNLFPAGGISGTIKDHYKSKNKPFVFAKTGTLRNNHNLSGFLIGKSKKKFIFSIMINHHKSSNEDVKKGIADLLFYLRKKL
tara:strand:+ start:820 stop:2118 length:1299 start_codon:yes stop_codon:yes gene_type:complete